MSGSPLTLTHAPHAAGSPSGAAPARSAFLPPPLPWRGQRHDVLTPAQRHLMIGAILAAHAVVLWGLQQIREVRERVTEVAPMFVNLIAPPEPKPVLPPPPPPPVPEYPRLSIRAGETGRVMLRIYIDEAGLPRTVQVERSSGHARLDEAGAAAMKKARFKPYTENGQAVAGWAFVPLDFALEK